MRFGCLETKSQVSLAVKTFYKLLECYRKSLLHDFGVQTKGNMCNSLCNRLQTRALVRCHRELSSELRPLRTKKL